MDKRESFLTATRCHDLITGVIEHRREQITKDRAVIDNQNTLHPGSFGKRRSRVQSSAVDAHGRDGTDHKIRSHVWPYTRVLLNFHHRVPYSPHLTARIRGSRLTNISVLQPSFPTLIIEPKATLRHLQSAYRGE